MSGMKVDKKLQRETECKHCVESKEQALKEQTSKEQTSKDSLGDSVRSFVSLSICACLAVTLAVGSKVLVNPEHSRVYAASESGSNSHSFSFGEGDDSYLPTGIAGFVSGVKETPAEGQTVERIGTSCEQVMVGQRVHRVEARVTQLNLSSSMESKVNDFDLRAANSIASAKLMTDEDYDNLLRIVEAEAGGEDLKGKTLVANVVLNRVKSTKFPDSVTDVVWEYVGGVPQFSPIYDGRIYDVVVSAETQEAVKQALEGVDYSEGALFFIEKATAEAHNISWFDKDLKRLFKYGVHDFYTYPDETDRREKTKDDSSVEGAENPDDNIVQMVKAD